MEIVMILLQILGYWILAYMASGIVHEGGHVVAGLMQGWKFLLMVVGPIKLYRDENDKVKLGIEKNILYWFGIGGTLPRKKGDENIRKFAKILLAGPLASILFGLLCGMSLLFGVTIFRAMITLMPITMGIFCLIPSFKTGILYSDGGRFLRIMKGGKTFAEEKALLDAVILDQCDPEGRHEEEDIRTMMESEDKSFQYLGHYYAYLNSKKDFLQSEMTVHMVAMKNLAKEVPKSIIDMCILEG